MHSWSFILENTWGKFQIIYNGLHGAVNSNFLSEV